MQVCEGLRAAVSTCPDSRPTPVELRAYMEYIYDCVVGAPASSTSAPDPRVPSQYIPASVVPTPTSVGEGARGSARIDRPVERGSGPWPEETRTARVEAAIKVCLGIGAPTPNAVASGLSREREAPLWRLRYQGSDGGCMIGSPVPGTAFSVTDLES